MNKPLRTLIALLITIMLFTACESKDKSSASQSQSASDLTPDTSSSTAAHSSTIIEEEADIPGLKAEWQKFYNSAEPWRQAYYLEIAGQIVDNDQLMPYWMGFVYPSGSDIPYMITQIVDVNQRPEYATYMRPYIQVWEYKNEKAQLHYIGDPMSWHGTINRETGDAILSQRLEGQPDGVPVFHIVTDGAVVPIYELIYSTKTEGELIGPDDPWLYTFEDDRTWTWKEYVEYRPLSKFNICEITDYDEYIEFQPDANGANAPAIGNEEIIDRLAEFILDIYRPEAETAEWTVDYLKYFYRYFTFPSYGRSHREEMEITVYEPFEPGGVPAISFMPIYANNYERGGLSFEAGPGIKVLTMYHQPMMDANGKAIIMFDDEVGHYDYYELSENNGLSFLFATYVGHRQHLGPVSYSYAGTDFIYFDNGGHDFESYWENEEGASWVAEQTARLLEKHGYKAPLEPWPGKTYTIPANAPWDELEPILIDIFNNH